MRGAIPWPTVGDGYGVVPRVLSLRDDGRLIVDEAQNVGVAASRLLRFIAPPGAQNAAASSLPP